MSWDTEKGTARTVIDSKGFGHYLMIQSFKMSCGPTSVAMVESQYKLQCMVDPEGRARQLSQKYEDKWTAESGTTMENLTEVLNAEGVKTYACTQVPTNKLWDYLSYYVKERTPTICEIQWTKGGHAVVCRKVYPDGYDHFSRSVVWFGRSQIVESAKLQSSRRGRTVERCAQYHI